MDGKIGASLAHLDAGNSPPWAVRRGDWKLLGNPVDQLQT